ncbi:MAG: YezD family protein [Puniceicoccales bacterium]|jgi:hypothetical protein|nr:YezD family protein [Puniceicoccales bacterium]
MRHHETQENAVPEPGGGSAPGDGEEKSPPAKTSPPAGAGGGANPASAGEQIPESWLEHVRRRVAATRFGAVQIVIHDGKVTQVEQTEKIRFPGK